MILKSLYDYAKMLGDKIPPEGLELKEIEFVIVIDAEGRFKRFESKRIDKRRCAAFMVAKGMKRTVAPKPNTLWDNGKYVLGLDESDQKCNSLFIDRVRLIAQDHPDDLSIKALVKFYDMPRDERERLISADSLYEDVRQSYGSNFSFRLETDDCLIAEKSYLFLDLTDSSSETVIGRCLVTGTKGPIVRTATPTPLPGCLPMASLVSFQKNSGYDSYGKKQAYNAPISFEADALYSAAIKKLAAKDSRNKVWINKRLFLFWGSSEREINRQFEESMAVLLGSYDNNICDDPDEKVDKVSKLFKSIFSGEITTTLDDRFHILGLAPHPGRIAVVLWVDCSLKDFAGKIFDHFHDMEIIDDRHPDKRRPFVGVYSMISAITQSDASNTISNLAENITKAILFGTPYPMQLYTAVLKRIRAELSKYSVPIQLAAIIKAYLNRATKNSSNIKPLQPMLDKTNDNAGYLCGRLAAVLEKIQKDADCGDSIRTRYLGAASTTPATVFPALLNVSVHHSDKLSEGSRIYYEQLKQEIIDKLSVDGFPNHLDLNDQGSFFVGYYHQRTDLYTKKED